MIEVAIQRGAADADRVGDLLHRVLSTVEHLAGDAQLGLGDGRGAATEATASARRLQPRLRALTDQLALELRDRPEDVEREAPRRAGRVDPLREAAKAELPFLELADQLDQMPQ